MAPPAEASAEARAAALKALELDESTAEDNRIRSNQVDDVPDHASDKPGRADHNLLHHLVAVLDGFRQHAAPNGDDVGPCRL